MKTNEKQANKSVLIRGNPCFLLVPLLLCVLCGSLFAQTPAVEIETLLQSDAITYAQAARFVLDAANQLTTSDQQEAYRYAAERNWLPKNAAQDATARLDGVSLLFMNAFEIEGGLFYSLTKAPRYAYRELVYRNFIQGRTAPNMEVSGELLIFVINRILGNRE